MPRSRHNPQFNKASLPRSLKNVGLNYVHMPGLGGLRHAGRDSLNMGWRNGSFRGFADYMQTLEFEKSLEQLIQLAKQNRIALMCAEAVPWRCHRSLIADALLVRGICTEDIMSLTRRPILYAYSVRESSGYYDPDWPETSRSIAKKSLAKPFGSQPIEKTRQTKAAASIS